MFPFLMFAVPAAAFLFLTRAKRAQEAAAPHQWGDVPQSIDVQPGDRWALTIRVSPAPSQELLGNIIKNYAAMVTQAGDAYVLNANLVPSAGTFAIALQYQRPGTVKLGQPFPLGSYTMQVIDARKL